MSLARYKITGTKCKRRGGVFATVLETIRTIRQVQARPNTSLRNFFVDKPRGGFNVREEPRDFMKHFYTPVVTSVKDIWGWRNQQVRGDLVWNAGQLRPQPEQYCH